MDKEILKATAKRLTNAPKGILAADESSPTCNKRFAAVGVPETEEKRRDYREILISTPGVENYISGVILYDETIRQKTKVEGKPFTEVLKSKGMDIGIKVDAGTIDLDGHPGEKVTKGLEGLPERLEEYSKMGATFAKWRAVINIGTDIPTQACLEANSDALTKYALMCQAANIVPMVEPEVILDGTHDIDRCYEVTARNLDIMFKQMQAEGVYMPGLILKTSMVISGKDAPERASREKVAEMTLKCLKEHVPSDIGGIVFLSGGQSEEEATEHLNLMHQEPLPWNLSFSYSRAIQAPVLKYWAQNPEDIAGVQKIYLRMAEQNSLATLGKYAK